VAYLLSKLTLLGAVSVVQSCVIVLLGVAGRQCQRTARS